MVACSVIIGSTPAATCIVSRDPDLNHNGTVDIFDASVVGAAFGSTLGSSNYNPAADLDGNGRVDILDASIFGAEWAVTLF